MNNIFYPKQLNKKRISISENQCFFAMPFSMQYKNVYDTLSLYVEQEGYKCIRVDNNSSASVPIINLILKGIATSQYIIVDISETNANVFYELGVTHTVKEAENVYIIKEQKSKTPFDIQHLQYIEYDKNDLKTLANKLVARLKANQYKNSLKKILSTKQILKYDDIDDFVDYLSRIFSEEKILIYTALLDESFSGINSNQIIIDSIWEYDKVLQKEIKNIESELYISSLFKILFELLLPCHRIDEISKYINDFLQKQEYSQLCEATFLSYKTDLAIKFSENAKLIDITLKWIIGYFQRSKSTKVDLNRYKLEAFLLKTDLQVVNEYIVNALVSGNNYVREHMADIVGEKKLYIAEDNLIAQLRHEDNIFTVSSIVEALGKINSKKSIDVIWDWLSHNDTELISDKNYFVLKHIRNALVKIDPQNAIKEFDSKYFELLVKNNTI
ncbi:MAG: hypothetical protein IKL73_06215 [Lachnospiraceae bacterium]|nr:hypothetical protein [Lachnospiraceae bacterium]